MFLISESGFNLIDFTSNGSNNETLFHFNSISSASISSLPFIITSSKVKSLLSLINKELPNSKVE
jgi:hypothetical protein